MTVYDVVDAFGLDFYEGNCIRYVICWRKRGAGVGDLLRARAYLDELIKRTGEKDAS